MEHLAPCPRPDHRQLKEILKALHQYAITVPVQGKKFVSLGDPNICVVNIGISLFDSPRDIFICAEPSPRGGGFIGLDFITLTATTPGEMLVAEKSPAVSTGGLKFGSVRPGQTYCLVVTAVDGVAFNGLEEGA